MRTRRWAQLALVPLLAGAGLVGPVAPAVAAPATQLAASTSELYVSKTWCPAGTGVRDGSPEKPFCTISEAAAVAGPGQTVLVQPGEYQETVRFTRSGTEAAPITFRAVNVTWQSVRVGWYDVAGVSGTILDLTGVHDVVVEGFAVHGSYYADAVRVHDSSRITLDKLSVHAKSAPSGLRIGGASADVTLSRSFVRNFAGPSVTIEAGVADTTVTASQLDASGLVATDAPGLTVTGNTVNTDCRRGIDLAGASPGASIRNNIVVTARQRHRCTNPADATAITVSPESVPQTSADYNLIDPLSGGAPYTWAGTVHPTLTSFVDATGQAVHDLMADPKIGWSSGQDRGYLETRDGSPARDSADANARGALDTDMLGGSYADDPATPNSGTGSGYRDRGAVEARGALTEDPVRLERKLGGGPLDVVARAGGHSSWTVERERSTYAYYFADGRYWRVTDSATAEHTLRRAGSACVQVQVSQTDFRTPSRYGEPVCTQVGARFIPVPPTRLLDTRAPIGVSYAAPVGPNGILTLPMGVIAGVPASDISAVVLNVTVTQPTASGFITAFPAGLGTPNASNVNFVAKETVPNQVTVPLGSDGAVSFRHTGSGTVHLVADLQGFYAASGSGFAPAAPVRVLDTREGAGPMPANSTRTLDLSGRVPANATAAVLNVTVTKPTASGVLTLFPAGSAVPVASNLNFVAGQTIPNLATAMVVNGELKIHNKSSGTTHVVVDLAGWFSPTATQTFVPITPTRIVDTRNGTGLPGRGSAPLAARETVRFQPFRSAENCLPACPAPTALVGNLTATGPTAAGVLIAYPGGQPRPTASNANFVAGETASNAAVVAIGSGIDLYNSSSGTTHAIADQSGYFIAAAS
ncbi:Right handed beta helix region [Micromonospora viridifaciens]|uniref:Right handed beta helix region n=1 Tax=Micromonospora viridifaciens TaxID=1881 RepID=A0A1C4UL52_MICVI|nr:right-handed parallel beta-helix repeat-containing protein [Micromonospora viridifaciens]SCE72433.1 Right handed beta helix region [Micromonospora viridifaciens]